MLPYNIVAFAGVCACMCVPVALKFLMYNCCAYGLQR